MGNFRWQQAAQNTFPQFLPKHKEGRVQQECQYTENEWYSKPYMSKEKSWELTKIVSMRCLHFRINSILFVCRYLIAFWAIPNHIKHLTCNDVFVWPTRIHSHSYSNVMPYGLEPSESPNRRDKGKFQVLVNKVEKQPCNKESIPEENKACLYSWPLLA